MKFSIWPNPERPPAEVLELARLGDDEGWFGFWYADHYMPNTGDTDVADGDVHECWSILPAIAVVTERIRLGPLVAPTSVHHPALLANRAATIDQLSNGRFVLGVGAGWQVNEHGAFGIDLEEPKVRVDRFEEAIQIMRSLLSEDRTDFAGTHYTITDAPCQPRPVQERLPLLVGTGSPRMLRITARHAEEWNTWGAPELAGERHATFVEQCERVEVDPSSLHTSVQAMVVMTDDAEVVANMEANDGADRMIVGSDERIIDAMNAYAELGFDEVTVPDFTLGRTAEARADAYRHFAGAIAPHVT
ncbi:MAG: LLM class flavin-dependent oxidoreductase [Actinomycetota bacterium]